MIQIFIPCPLGRGGRSPIACSLGYNRADGSQSAGARRLPDVYVIELNVQKDHVHALLEIPPKYSVSSVVGYIKGVTARSMRMHFEFLRRAQSLWADGFYVSTVGYDEKKIRDYIQYQNKQASGQALLASV